MIPASVIFGATLVVLFCCHLVLESFRLSSPYWRYAFWTYFGSVVVSGTAAWALVDYDKFDAALATAFVSFLLAGWLFYLHRASVYNDEKEGYTGARAKRVTNTILVLSVEFLAGSLVLIMLWNYAFGIGTAVVVLARIAYCNGRLAAKLGLGLKSQRFYTAISFGAAGTLCALLWFAHFDWFALSPAYRLVLDVVPLAAASSVTGGAFIGYFMERTRLDRKAFHEMISNEIKGSSKKP